MKKHVFHRFSPKCVQGFTFPELLIAVSIMTLVGAQAMALFQTTIWEQRIAFVEREAQEQADRLQDRITQILIEGGNGGVFLTDADTSNPGWFHTIQFRADNGGGETTQRLMFDPDPNDLTLTYIPDLDSPGTTLPIAEMRNNAAADEPVIIQNVRFRKALRVGYNEDSSLILVSINVGDRGFTFRSRDSGSLSRQTTIDIQRDFSVNLRNGIEFKSLSAN